MEINVANNLHALYLEHVIPKYMQVAFITQTLKDDKLFHDYVANEIHVNGLRTTCLDSPARPHQRVCDINDIKKYGVTHWLDEVFECPQVVKEALRCNSSIHTMAVCDGSSDKYIKQLVGHESLSIFLTPTNAYSVNKSRYGRQEKSTRVDPMAKTLKYLSGVDTSQRKKLIETIQLEEQYLKEMDVELKKLVEKENSAQQSQNQLKTEKVIPFLLLKMNNGNVIERNTIIIEKKK